MLKKVVIIVLVIIVIIIGYKYYKCKKSTTNTPAIVPNGAPSKPPITVKTNAY